MGANQESFKIIVEHRMEHTENCVKIKIGYSESSLSLNIQISLSGFLSELSGTILISYNCWATDRQVD